MADYAISNVPRRVVYEADGVGPYSFTFEILVNTDVAVYKDNLELTLGSDYTVVINSNGTGNITLSESPTGASQIAIVGARAIERSSDFVTGGDFFANTVNEELDSLTIFAQQNAEAVGRALQAPQTDPTSINMTLPRAVERAGRYLAFDDDGNPAPGPTSVDISTVVSIASDIQTVSDISSNVTTVAENDANVTTVAGISGNVTTVAGVASAVSTVAGNTSNINTVAGANSNISTVAGSISNVNAVGTNISNVNAVNSNATNINTVAGQITPTNNVSTVAGVSAAVATVAGISANVTTVATNNSNVSTVATNISNVNAVGGNISNVNAVAGNASNINSVVSNATNINTVAGISSNVTTVATNNANVTTVAGSIASVNTNATNIANINQNAANITAIQNASANATAAAASATSAANSATDAATSAAQANAVSLSNEPIRHSVRPSLLLDFANTKALDPRITFTRASEGRFYGTQVAKAEENLVIRSQEFNSAGWPASNLSVSENTSVAPDGTNTADTLTGNGVSASHYVFQNFAASSVQRTLSVYAKAGTNSFVQLWCSSDTNCFANFDLSTGTVGTVGSAVTASIVGAGNGWYRCSFVTSSATASSFVIGLITSGTSARNESNTLTTTVLVWGAQLEQRSSVTAYTPTTTQLITNYIPVLQTAAAGVARFDHNPTTGESLGLLIEEQRTNLLTYSEQFDNAAWTKIRTSVSSDVVVAPNGALTGDKIIENTDASTSHYIFSDVSSLSNATPYTITVYAKAGERGFLYITSYGGAYSDVLRRAYFNLTTGAVGTVGADVTASIVAVGNGWYRCTTTRTTTGTGTVRFELGIASADNNNITTGDGYSGIYIWGAQLEAGAFPTSYIPTVASQVTRSADVAVMTGANFSSWYNAGEGSVFVEFNATSTPFTQGSRTIVDFDQAISFVYNPAYRWLSSTVNDTATGTSATGVNSKMAGGIDGFGYAYSYNGVAPRTGTAVIRSLGANTLSIFLSNAGSGSSRTTGTIKKIAYYPKRLSNTELQALTS